MTDVPADPSPWAAFYGDRLDDLLRLLDGGDLDPALPVPATPQWTLRDVVAHLAGVGADMVAGRLDGAPGEAWTARQVAERADRTLAELIEELRDGRDAAVAAVAASGVAPPAFDSAVHLADLHEALGLPAPASSAWAPILEAVADRVAPLRGRVPDYELFRAAFSRRSRRQLQAMAPHFTAEEIELVGVFGTRDDDQPVPPTAGGGSG
ncbi:maleylpyruvate isomerase N-terminal domain-containing protein [Nocardioides sp.]|uniref:maleylpyruvate isomerase N-terminal domain-containing protein n=1 Tax=Nocardioides sp. TaxID=35761 RepID=UPI0035171551